MKNSSLSLVISMMVLGIFAAVTAAEQPALAKAKAVAAQASQTTKANEEAMEIVEEEKTPKTEQSAAPSENNSSKKTNEPILIAEEEEPAAPGKTAADEAESQPDTNSAASNRGASSSESTSSADILNKGSNIDEIDLEDDTAEASRRAKVKVSDSGPQTLVSIDCDDASLADILRQFRKTTGRNIISGDFTNLQRRVSVTLCDVPWHQALTTILNSGGFRLDKSEDIYRVVENKGTSDTTKTFPLKHASAKELSDLFNKTYAPRDKNGKPIRTIATCFESANVVVVTAEEKVISECEAIIEKIDKAVAQIYIEARFLELSSEAMHKLGLNWSALSSWSVSAKNITGGWENNFGRVANYSSKEAYTKKMMEKTGSSLSDSKSISDTSPSTSTSLTDSYTDLSDGSKGIGPNLIAPTTIGAAEGAGRSAASMAWSQAGGFAGQLSADDFTLALSAFEQFGEGKVFSNPKIIVSNGKKAKVDMTTKEPNVSISSDYTGTSSQNLSISTKLEVIPGEDKQMFAKEAFFSYGIELTVTPRISPDGLISVEIVPTISEKTGDKEIAGASTSAPYTTYPIINVKRLTTEFTMKSGSTAVIGGLTQTTEDDVDSGIPYLRKIPWIGPKLFGWKSRQKVQKEIIICVTLGIANPNELQKDIGLPKNAVIGREYINGERLEPGDREGSAAKVLSLDMRSLEDQKKEIEKTKFEYPSDRVETISPDGKIRMSSYTK